MYFPSSAITTFGLLYRKFSKIGPSSFMFFIIANNVFLSSDRKDAIFLAN